MAAPLTKGSASGDGVNAPGRRQEDDVNIVIAFGHKNGIDAQASETVVPTLRKNVEGAGISNASGVRRLTPVECERLQGLPDGWTQLDASTPDSRRYSALGDAVTANVAEWIGLRLLAQEPVRMHQALGRCWCGAAHGLLEAIEINEAAA